MSASDRFLRLGGSRNFRHMGGYLAADCRLTRADRLFRSGWFDLDSKNEAERFASLGITQVFDLRTDEERDRQPVRVDSSSTRLIALPITSGSMGAYLDSVSQLAPSEIDCKSAMVRMYREMPAQGESSLRQLFGELAAGDAGALIICATGKDRTGLASALLLTALGVAKDDVLGDYMISAEVYRGHEEEFARRLNYEQRTGHDLRLFRDVFTVHPEYLEAVSEGALEALSSRLVTEPVRRQLLERFIQ